LYDGCGNGQILVVPPFCDEFEPHSLLSYAIHF
jgi:hypothetical protein